MAHQARKRFGQNFLHDQLIIDQIIDALHPQTDNHIVEIGPGQGALTRALLLSRARLDLIELDRDLISHLQTLSHGHENVRIHNCDILKFNIADLITSDIDHLRVIGNLPYNISTPLIFHLLDYADIIEDMHFMLQKEVVQRLAAEPGNKHYGRLGIMVQYFCQVDYLLDVPPESFHPAPKVDSAVVRLTPRQQIKTPVTDISAFKRFLTQAFSQRRKTLRNNLKGVLGESQIVAAGIDPAARAETLTIEQLIHLANLLPDDRHQ